MAKLLRSRMSLPLSLGRTLLVCGLVASNRKEDSGHELGFRLGWIQKAGAVAMVLEKASWCVDNFWDFLKLSLPCGLYI